MCFPAVNGFCFSTLRLLAVLCMGFSCALNTPRGPSIITLRLFVCLALFTLWYQCWCFEWLYFYVAYKNMWSAIYISLMSLTALNVNINIYRGFLVFHFSLIAASTLLCPLLFRSLTTTFILKEWFNIIAMILIGPGYLFPFEFRMYFLTSKCFI